MIAISETAGCALSYHVYANSKEHTVKRLRLGWYIILYHDISWEENCYVRSIGGTCPPDVFHQHVKALASLGELVSITEGEKRLREDTIGEPIFSFWFDDGLYGVAKYAMPILEQFDITAAISICSRFVNRTEFFWRFKLAYLNSVDGMRFLRSRLRKHGFIHGNSVRTYTLDNFSFEILGYIDELFNRFTTSVQREDAFRMFMDRNAVLAMLGRDWTIANHTAAHYPISEDNCLHLLPKEFNECEEVIKSICKEQSHYWVLPFDINSSARVVSEADSIRGNRYIVYCGDRRNTPEYCNTDRVLYRIYAPVGSPQRLLEKLKEAKRR